MEMTADELHQLLIAHRIRCAFGDLRPLELRGPAQVTPELFLDRARARQMHLIRILQMVADSLKYFCTNAISRWCAAFSFEFAPGPGFQPSIVHHFSLFYNS